MLLDHYLPHLFENFEQFNVSLSHMHVRARARTHTHTHTHTHVPVSCIINRIVWLLCFLHCALWYNYAMGTNEMRTFQINTLIQFFYFWHLPRFKSSWEWTHEVWNMQRTSKIEKFNQSIIWKSVYFVGSCYIRIFWHYGQRKQTSHLLFISLVFDDSCQAKKGTCPSDLAVVLPGRHNTHLVTFQACQ
jgi:hypothetical protein